MKVKSNPEPMEYRPVEDNEKQTTAPERQPVPLKSVPTPRKIIPKTKVIQLYPQLLNKSGHTLYDERNIEKFSKAWRCTICKKIISTKKVAIEHLKEFHPKI